MNRRLLGLILVFVLLAAVSVFRGSSQPEAIAQRRPSTSGGFDKGNYKPARLLDGLPPIVNPPYVDAKEASRFLEPNHLVLGVEIDGVARAYAINMLTGPDREIFNDQLGEHDIAATW